MSSTMTYVFFSKYVFVFFSYKSVSKYVFLHQNVTGSITMVTVHTLVIVVGRNYVDTRSIRIYCGITARGFSELPNWILEKAHATDSG